MTSQASGDAQPSITSSLVEKSIREHGSVSSEDEEIFKDVTGLAYGGRCFPIPVGVGIADLAASIKPGRKRQVFPLHLPKLARSRGMTRHSLRSQHSFLQ